MVPGGSTNCKKRGPFFFFSSKPNKILQLPSKLSEDLFLFFLFLVSIPKNGPRGSRNSKRWGPFFFFSPKPNKTLQLNSKISEDLLIYFIFFSPNSKKMVAGGRTTMKALLT